MSHVWRFAALWQQQEALCGDQSPVWRSEPPVREPGWIHPTYVVVFNAELSAHSSRVDGVD